MVTISTAAAHPRELATAAELRALLDDNDVSGLEWTDEVKVQAHVRSRSHPVLTINTLRSGDALLSVYLHEQLHWWLADHPGLSAALDQSTRQWIDVPTEAAGGARSEVSTRLHLFVCRLEHAALGSVVGDARAETELHRKVKDGPYPWVWLQVLTRAPELGNLCDQFGLWPKRLRHW